MTQRVLVTGGAGFIGSHLVDRLVQSGMETVVLDDLSSGFLENLQKVFNNDKFHWIQGDVRNSELIKKISRNCRYIYHLSAFIPNQVGHVIKSSTTKPDIDFDVTVRGTISVLEAAKDSGAKVLFASSGAVYGEPGEKPASETDPLDVVSPYGASKLSAEIYCNLYNRVHGVPVVIARIFNTYGPRQRKYLMYDIVKRLYNDPSRLTVYGTGEQVRDFTFVEDIVDGLVLLMEKQEGVFNLGSGKGIKIRKIVECICEKTGLTPEIRFTKQSWKGDIGYLVADISKARRIGYYPTTRMDEGLDKFLSWFKCLNSLEERSVV